MTRRSLVPHFCLLPFAFCLAALTLVAAPQAPNGTIRGRVRLPETPAGIDRRPSIADLGTTPHEAVDRRRCVAYLQSAPREAFDELPPGHARMDQRNEQFIPRVLAVTVGTVVDFPNNDATFHNVFSFAREKTFDLGRYPKGESKAVTFEKPGIIPISCDIHRHMSAYILVFSHPFFTMTDDDGRYAIPGVPPGTYTLRLWSELGDVEPRRITIPDTGGVIEVDFQVGRKSS
jgi:plastocyanin